MLAIFHVSEETPWVSEDSKIWTRGNVTQSHTIGKKLAFNELKTLWKFV